MRTISAVVTMVAMIIVSLQQVSAQAEDNLAREWSKMHESKKEALKKFNEAKFGMFIHWGAYSLPAGIWNDKKIPGLGEWVMFHAQIAREEYEN